MGIFSSILGNITKDVLGQGDKMSSILDKASDKIGEKMDQSVNGAQVNLENAYKRLKPIQETNYSEFQNNPESYIQREGILWFVRKDLEGARFYYSGGKEGYHVSDRVQGNGILVGTPPFLKLKDYLEKTEEKVMEMEKAKGYEFVCCESNNIIFREISSGRELTPEESSRI